MSITFDSRGISTEEGTATIYIYNVNTGVFDHQEEYAFSLGRGAPGGSTIVAPPTVPEGDVAVWDAEKNQWNIVESHIGTQVYRKTDGAPATIQAPGPIPSDVTTVAPTNSFSKWDDSKGEWVINPEARVTYLKNAAEQAMSALTQTASRKGWTMGFPPMPDDVKAYATALMAFINGTNTTDNALPTPPSDLS